VRDKDVWPLQEHFNEILARTAPVYIAPVVARECAP
jgi:hypothetical protein